MEQCVKCEKEFKTKDLFLQWITCGEAYICKDCIEKHKQYIIDPCYADDSDITFVSVIIMALQTIKTAKNSNNTCWMLGSLKTRKSEEIYLDKHSMKMAKTRRYYTNDWANQRIIETRMGIQRIPYGHKLRNVIDVG